MYTGVQSLISNKQYYYIVTYTSKYQDNTKQRPDYGTVQYSSMPCATYTAYAYALPPSVPATDTRLMQ